MLGDSLSQNKKQNKPQQKPARQTPPPSRPNPSKQTWLQNLLPDLTEEELSLQQTKVDTSIRKIAEATEENLAQTIEIGELATAPVKPCDLSGTIINDLYRVEGLLSTGGMGQVLLCTQLQRDMMVVMKQMLLAADPEDLNFQRFMQEIRITSRLSHPNLVKVHDYGILFDGFKPYLVMEFLPGRSLRQILKTTPQLHPGEIAEILMQTCKGLFEVHSKGIVHRDLKPDNLIILGDFQAEDNVKILDFGVAQLSQGRKLEEEGYISGTIGYMSPEQILGNPVDQRTDIYSLGVILYESIIGFAPYTGKNAQETMKMHALETFPPTSQFVNYPISASLDHICQRALAKNPDERFQNVKEFYQALASILPPNRQAYRSMRQP